MILEQRVQREIQHGESITAAAQPDAGWNTPAGKIRRQRRINFITHGLNRNATVLEIGCGTGLQTADLASYFNSMVAFDVSPDLLAVASKRIPNVEFKVMDAHHLEFPDMSFDAVVGVSILHHLDWDIALREATRVLKPGGVLRFSEPNLLNPQIYLQKNIPWLKRLAGDSPDEYAFTKWEICRVLNNAGLVNISVNPYEFLHPSTPQRLIPIVERLEGFVSKTPLIEIAGSLLIEAYRPPASTDAA